MTLQRLKSDLRNGRVVTRGSIGCLFNILRYCRATQGPHRPTAHTVTNKTLDKQTNKQRKQIKNQLGYTVKIYCFFTFRFWEGGNVRVWNHHCLSRGWNSYLIYTNLVLSYQYVQIFVIVKSSRCQLSSQILPFACQVLPFV